MTPPDSNGIAGGVDALLAMIPTDVFWQVGHDGDGPDPSVIKARLFAPLDMVRPCDGWGDTAAEALAEALAKYGIAVVPHHGEGHAQANIILVSQDRSGQTGYQLHGLFQTFAAAARHVAKDAQLTAEQRDDLVKGWSTPGNRHESAEAGEWWVAARQPIRALATTPDPTARTGEGSPGISGDVAAMRETAADMASKGVTYVVGTQRDLCDRIAAAIRALPLLGEAS